MKEQNTIYKMMKKFTVFLVLQHIFKYAIRMLENKHQAKTFVIHVTHSETNIASAKSLQNEEEFNKIIEELKEHE